MLLFLTFHPILIALAVLPAVFLLVQIYRADRVEHESKKLLLKLLFWGAVATIPAVIVELIGSGIVNLLFPQYSLVNLFFTNFIVVAGAEEFFKYFFMKRRTWNSAEFNCLFDGIVYAVFCSLGFAILENIEYVFIGGISTALMRAVTAIPGHASFGVFMGMFYGLAKQAERKGNAAQSQRFRKLAVLAPVLFHGAYDFFASSGSGISFAIFVLLIIMMFVLAIRTVRKFSRLDHYL